MKNTIILCFWEIFIVNVVCFSQNPWPGELWQNSVNLTSLDAHFNVNMSGQFWNPLKRELWLVSNSGFFWKLKEGGPLGFMIDNTNGQAKWSPGGDLEDITQANLNDNSVFVINEGGFIQEFDVSIPGTVNLIHSWDIRLHTGVNGTSGVEGITFVPDEWLSYNGFIDRNNLPYTSVNGMGGLMFIAHQTGGYIYVFDLNRSSNSYIFVGKYETGYAESSGLAFDRSVGKLFIWHNIGSNYIEVSQLESYSTGGENRKLIMQTSFYGPKTGNLEGIAFTPASSGENWYFATDDGNQNGYAVFWFTSYHPCVFEPAYLAEKTIVCVGEYVSLADTTIGLCGYESYHWTFGSDASPPEASGKGPHIVSYSSPGTKNISLIITGLFSDTTIKSSYITVNNLPNIEVLASDTVVCEGTSVLLAGNGANTYLWSDDISDGVAFMPQTTSTYSVTGTDENSCRNTATVTVTVYPLPDVVANVSDSVVCEGGEIVLYGSGASTYEWSDSISDGVAYVPHSTSSYSVTGTNENSCTNTATVTITVYPLPDVVANVSDSVVCEGTEIVLYGSGASTFEWSDSISDGVAIVPHSTSSYSVTGTDENNCTNTATINVMVNPLPDVVANASDSVVCQGVEVVLNGSGASTYEWTDNITDGIWFFPHSSTTYSVTGTDDNNCINTATVSITVHPLPDVSFLSFHPDTVCINYEPFIITGGVPDNGIYSEKGEQVTVFYPSLAQSGVHVIVYSFTDENGCSNSASQVLYIDECTGISYQNTEVFSYIYPNPNNGLFTISIPDYMKTAEVMIYTLSGKLFYHNFAGQQSLFPIDLSSMQKGMYLLMLYDGERTITEKLVVQ